MDAESPAGKELTAAAEDLSIRRTPEVDAGSIGGKLDDDKSGCVGTGVCGGFFQRDCKLSGERRGDVRPVRRLLGEELVRRQSGHTRETKEETALACGRVAAGADGDAAKCGGGHFDGSDAKSLGAHAAGEYVANIAEIHVAGEEAGLCECDNDKADRADVVFDDAREAATFRNRRDLDGGCGGGEPVGDRVGKCLADVADCEVGIEAEGVAVSAASHPSVLRLGE